jgi:H+/Cl- antiporter ClcA
MQWLTIIALLCGSLGHLSRGETLTHEILSVVIMFELCKELMCVCVCVCVCVCMYVFHVSLIAIKCYILGINDKDNKTLK